MSRGDFFAVDRQHFEKACDLGINPVLAFLVIARGTQRDLRTSAWSADAVRRYCRMRWKRAQGAIAILQDARLIARDKKSAATHPRYVLSKPEHERLIWLPNSLVEGVESEEPPVARLRRSQSPEAVRLLVRLYSVHDLQEEGGVPTALLRDMYTRKHIADHGLNTVWAFDYDTSYLTNTDIFDCIPPEERWEVVRLLERLGLLHPVPYLFDADHEHGEPIHPLGGAIAGEVMEAIIEYLDATGGTTLQSVEHAATAHDFVLPVERTTPNPSVVGIYQMRYVPHAAYSLEGMATMHQTCLRAAQFYRRLAAGGQARMATLQ